MRTYAPEYYTKFHCIADKCRHSCCVGWEIDVDEETLLRYQKTAGEIGARLARSIEDGHFALLANERCPFLNPENLCDIILTLGEDALCQICRDHPRYRNFMHDRVEIGLGLSCEAAATLILTYPKRPSEVVLSGDTEKPTADEKLFLQLREDILDLMFDTEYTAPYALANIEAAYGLHVPDISALYGELSHLHASWKDVLLRIHAAPLPMPDMGTRQLFAYFLHRHLAGGLSDGRWHARLAFCLHATKMVLRLSPSKEAFIETARRYSEEIEYAEENMEAILRKL